RQLHVTRAVQCYAWEAYDAGGNVILSRESRKWVRELIGTIALDHFSDADDLRDELVCLIFQAVAGSSRLPLTSVEAPLPGFSLGQLAYFYRSHVSPNASPSCLTSFRELLTEGLRPDLSWLEKAKLLETVLRTITPDQVQEGTELFVEQWQRIGHPRGEISPLCRTLFNEVALSPYTEFVGRFLDFWRMLVEGE